MARTQRRSAPSRSAPAPSSRPQSHVPAQTAAQPPAPQAGPQQPSLFANMASTAAGVAVGSAVGHTIGAGISGIFGGGGSRETHAQPQTQPPVQSGSVCDVDERAFTKCLEGNSGDIGACQYYFEQLKACRSAAQTF